MDRVPVLFLRAGSLFAGLRPLLKANPNHDARTGRFAGSMGSDTEKARILQGAPVAAVSVDDVPLGGYADLEKWAADVFAKQGGKALSPEIGEVVLDARSAKTSLAHGGANQSKKAAFSAVKDVIEKGALVLRATTGNNDSFYFAAPVSISGRANIVTVLVRRDHNAQRMYLHSVSLKKNLLNPRVSSVDATASERSGSTNSGDNSTVSSKRDDGKASPQAVADELRRLLALDGGVKQQKNAGSLRKGGHAPIPLLFFRRQTVKGR